MQPPLIPPGLAAIAHGRDTLPTKQAASALNRQPQTLRKWACKGGPIAPVRINGVLAWPVAELAQLINGGSR